MSPYHVPSLLIDPAALPPPLLNSEPGSFQHWTMTTRVPRIIDEAAESNPFPPYVRHTLGALREEILTGAVQPLLEDTPDRQFWNTVSEPYLGKPWLAAPWLWSETFFYRRLLEATCYFETGPWQGFDPFAYSKNTEWQPAVAPQAVGALLAALPAEPLDRYAILLQGSLWGNRIDLSYKHVSAEFQASEGVAAHHAGDAANLLVDDTDRTWAWLAEGAGGRVTLIADNAGTELAMDLALIDFLLSQGLAGELHLHLKPQPFFVSDAMPADLDAGLAALEAYGAATRALAERIAGYREAGRLHVSTHWSYATHLCYFQAPLDLLEDLGASRLVIFKGDANYRRLLSDGHWPPAASFETATAYFPARFVSLRTLKSDVIAGLAPGQAAALQEIDPAWRVNGRRGVIQSSPGKVG